MKKKLKILSYLIRIPIAIIISPILYLFFKISPNKLFFHIFSALWPHLTILDENGKLYLRRWFLSPKTRWFRPWFLHFIGQSDKGRLSHNHPGEFDTWVKSGGYVESVFYPKYQDAWHFVKYGVRRKPLVHSILPDMHQYNEDGHTHMVTLIAPTYTIVRGWIRGKPWGFWELDPIDPHKDVFIESETYGNKGEEVMSWE